MRKIFLIVILIAMPLFLFSEKKVWKAPAAKELLPMDESGRVVYTEVIEMPAETKDALYSRALEWFAKTFNSANNVIQMQDKDNGKLIGKALFEVTLKDISRYPGGVVHYMFSVYTKDGKYKYEMTDFIHDRANIEAGIGSGGDLSLEKPACGKGFLGVGGLSKTLWRQIKEQANEYAKPMIADFKAFMAGQAAKDNW